MEPGLAPFHPIIIEHYLRIKAVLKLVSNSISKIELKITKKTLTFTKKTFKEEYKLLFLLSVLG